MFDMATLFPDRSLHPGMAKLGRLPWLRRSFDDQRGDLMSRLELDVLAQARHDPDVALLLDAMEKGGWMKHGRLMTGLFQLSRVFAEGPKVLYPSLATCRCLAETEIRITPSEYTQPYDALIVVLPPEWADEVCVGYTKTASKARFRYAIVTRTVAGQPDDAIITLMLTDRGFRAGETMMTFSIQVPRRESIEDLLRVRTADETDNLVPIFEAATRIDRMALNVCLLATYAGVKGPTWLDPKSRTKHESLARRGAAMGAKFLAGDVARLDFARDVELLLGVSIAERTGSGGGGVDGATVRPHWRRRHWYMQAYGPGYASRRLRLRRGTFVRAHALPAGTVPGDVQAGYDARLPGEDDDAGLPPA